MKSSFKSGISILILSSTLLANSPKLLPLESCIDIALENNPELAISKKQVDKANAEVWEAVGTLLPSVDANANFSHAWEIQTNTIPNFLKPMLAPLAPVIPEFADMPDYVQLAFGLENTFTYGATLSQPLFLGGAGIASIQMARAFQKSSQHEYERTRQNLIYNTADAFYQCILAKEMVQVQKDALAQAEANLDIVLKKYDVGAASGLDKMRAQVDAANIKPAYISAKNAYQAALTQLKTVMGMPLEDKIQPQGILEYTEDTFSDLSLEEIQNLSEKNRPELLSMTAQEKVASKGIALARSEFLPKLIFSTDYSYLAMKNDYHFNQDDFSKGFTSAFTLQMPLFHGFRSCKNYQKAQLDYKITLDSKRMLEDGIRAEVEITYNTFREAKEKYQSAAESIAMAEEAMRLANLMYEEGASTQLEVLSSQLALTQSKLNFITSLYEYQMARYNFRRATGTLTEIL